jgi:hypothetical protein
MCYGCGNVLECPGVTLPEYGNLGGIYTFARLVGVDSSPLIYADAWAPTEMTWAGGNTWTETYRNGELYERISLLLDSQS